jgi:hypothetical protein
VSIPGFNPVIGIQKPGTGNPNFRHFFVEIPEMSISAEITLVKYNHYVFV